RIFNTLQVLGCQLGDVNHSILARSELDKRAKIGDAHDLAGEDLAQVRVVGQHMDAFQRRLRLQTVDAGHENRAVFLNIDRDLELFFQAADGRPTLADDRADLL